MTDEKQVESEPTIDLQDLSNATGLIALAIERGAFKPGELTLVGTTHQKIMNFLVWQQKGQAKLAEQTADNAADIEGEK